MKKSKKKEKYKFIDLFAGIGGFHLAFHNEGGQCVFASEWDDHARKTYQHNFSKIEPDLFKEGIFANGQNLFAGDITKVDKSKIPDFDILTAGFPCQPFSQAGYKKGFDDTRGTLFFDIVEIIKEKKPKAFFLENVRGLYNHDDGKTFEIIKNTLKRDLGYSFYHKIVKASDHGLPQLRPRLFMIGFKNTDIEFEFPETSDLEYTMTEVFEEPVSRDIGFTLRVGGRGSDISDRRNWDSYLVGGKVKRLTSKEGKRMQGFPDEFEFPVTETQAMKQLGNSVAVKAIQAYAKKIIEALDKYYE